MPPAVHPIVSWPHGVGWRGAEHVADVGKRGEAGGNIIEIFDMSFSLNNTGV